SVAAVAIVLAASVPEDAWSKHQATQCVLRAHGERYPVTYLERERNNPDGSYYPGDAFYYLFWWRDYSDPGECSMQKPILETEGLWLNHSSRTVGPLDPGTGSVVFGSGGSGMQHKPLDPSVRLMPYISYYRTDGPAESCKTTFAKPGESWSIRWTKYVVYDKPSLVKQQKSPDLTNAEAGARKRGDASWTIWSTDGRKGSFDWLESCAFAHGQGQSGSDAPHELEIYRKNGKDFFYTPTHKWEFYRDVNATHAHAFDVLADNGTRLAFDTRVSEVCGSLGADSGCMYGTAQIKPHGGLTCLYAEAERIMGEKWMSEPDKDNDGIKDIHETEEDDPPPPLLPPNIPVSQYEPPAGDACISSEAGNPQLKLVIGGYYWTASHRVQAGIEYPIRGYTNVTADRSPDVHAILNAILTKPPLLHADGMYDAKNLDGTYYHDDPIHIRHEPSWGWSEARAAHINFTTVRLHNVIPIDDEYDCDTLRQEEDGIPGSFGTCQNSTDTSSDSWLRQLKKYGNGDGRTVHVADTGFAFGTYDFAYNMTAYNMGVPVSTNNGTDSINATLVPYEPVYETVYSYPVLADAQEYAFDDRRGIVVKYAGSLQDGHTYGERRSFVNWWNASGGGHTPFKYEEFNQTHALSAARSAPPDAEPPVLEHAAGAQSAMFTSAGYGVLYMEWPVTDHVFAELVDVYTNKTARGAKYENVTAQSEFRSEQFAGHANVTLFGDAMRYPEMPFTKQVLVRSVDQQGNTQWGDTITLRVVPYADIAEDQAWTVEAWEDVLSGNAWLTWLPWLQGGGGNSTELGDGGEDSAPLQQQIQQQQSDQDNPLGLEGAETIADYMRDKVMHDTGGDPVVTGTVLNDTYDMTQEWAGRGQVDATVMRTSAYFSDMAVQQQMNASLAPVLDIASGDVPRGIIQSVGDIMSGLVDRPDTLRMSAPLDVGLSMLPPTSVYVSVNGGPERVMHHKYYAFGVSETININVRTDNTIDVKRIGANGTGITVRQPDNFGAITGVRVNGTDSYVQCTAGCLLTSMPSNETVRVTVYNEWGGEAHGDVPPAEFRAAPVSSDPGWRVFLGAAVLLVIAAYVSKKLFGKHLFGGGR
ncbi:MAG: hypothetical protein J4F28_08400, partial [Nitrosopumilaceae archaeon]|nr:hypothetical protein [Nitrosopumilaceae archaeon]